ncbi:unnamed protein product [Dracunculus medinensis]|uniref:Uncharacterized protein n=1 Tax=Dracunculus medinensis TaxID=318479 RepID=A0A0N4UHA8_DRAME|nr:unnamed protein product [Dracunculus medinensis]
MDLNFSFPMPNGNHPLLEKIIQLAGVEPKESKPMNDSNSLIDEELDLRNPYLDEGEEMKMTISGYHKHFSTKKAYNQADYYHTLPPKRSHTPEKVLTFCTKETALRDSHNLVIACGSEIEIWKPPRCPHGSECFLSPDATYRICCIVANSAQFS